MEEKYLSIVERYIGELKEHEDTFFEELGMTWEALVSQVRNDAVPLMQACMGVIGEESDKIELNHNHDSTRANKVDLAMSALLAIIDDNIKENPLRYAENMVSN